MAVPRTKIQGKKINISVANPSREQYESRTPSPRNQVDINNVTNFVGASGTGDPLALSYPSVTIIAGKTQTGKTNLLSHFFRTSAKNFHKVWVLCPTVHEQKGYDWIPNKYCFSEEEQLLIVLQQIFEQQGQCPKRRVAVILDDFIGSISTQNNKLLEKIATRGRHRNISFFILTQDLKKVSSTIRDNANYLFITSLKEHSLRTAFDMSSGFESFDCFKKLIEETNASAYNIIRLDLTGRGQTHQVFNPGVCPKFFLNY